MSIKALQERFPWPANPPEVEPFDHGWLGDGTARMLTLHSAGKRVIVEMGSWLGKSIQHLAKVAPEAHIVAIDHWDPVRLGRWARSRAPELYEATQRCYDIFLRNCWELRGRLTPIRMDNLEAARLLTAMGVVPDMAYLDTAHTYDRTLEELHEIFRLWPNVRLVGDDWTWGADQGHPVQRAVRTFLEGRTDLTVEFDHQGWVLVPTRYDERIYWDGRYRTGGKSGGGSLGVEAHWKVDQALDWAGRLGVESILDFGFGDGLIAKAILAGLPPTVSYRGVDIAPTAVRWAEKNLPLSNASFEVGDFGVEFRAEADLVLCFDVLFHQATAERQQQVITNICNGFRKAALVVAWNDTVVEAYGGRFGKHVHYRPFIAPEGIVVTEVSVPMDTTKTLYVLTRA